jgi:hypothetical protein
MRTGKKKTKSFKAKELKSAFSWSLYVFMFVKNKSKMRNNFLSKMGAYLEFQKTRDLQIRHVNARAARTAWTVQPKMLVRSSLPQLELLQMASLLVTIRSIIFRSRPEVPRLLRLHLSPNHLLSRSNEPVAHRRAKRSPDLQRDVEKAISL